MQAVHTRTSAGGAGWHPSVTSTHGAIGLQVERTDLAALLHSCLSPLIAQASATGIELRVDVLGELPRVAVDREKIGWAVVTLVGAALRYVAQKNPTAPGGSILVHLAHDVQGDAIALAVHDDGPGVPADKLPHLFVRRPGALHADGLALSLVRDVIGAHDGGIEVETSTRADAHGTSITLRLPVAGPTRGAKP